MQQNPNADREFVIERTFDAPREMVFMAWSKAEHLQQWFGPTGWSLPVCKLDFRAGGEWLYCMRGPDGTEAWGKALYREIVAPERIVYVDYFADAQGNPAEGMPETLVTLIFEDQGDKTRLISRTLFASVADMNAIIEMGMVEGLNQTWDRLEAHLESLV